ncbi:carbohydrate ABC transporter permease [Anaerobacillus sp. CMMVII]|uniref:carbohydrate ABC transporter permease n=1 Tax=Anaerobacillus sp. CMMVII TaxID=2755588 RepID=UPI0021B84C8D|nr:carbohydrate ABC transporter permease [Anaerobacillus sp. CMMVII]MCT8139291.1 carbohydrate ABC transporter permease [Anaerobacillus sp. CMMVII]
MKRVFWYIAISVYALIMIFPLLWMFSTAFKSSNEIFSLTPSFIPEKFTFQAFKDVLMMDAYRRYLGNSLFVATCSTLISVVLSSLAGYGFSRFYFRGRKRMLHLFLSAQMIPGVLLLMPIFFIMTKFKLIDSYLGLILAYVTFSLPFSTWIMTGFYKGIPRELEEAAMIDGASRFQAFLKIIVPLAVPGMISTGIFSFLVAWDEFLFTLTLTSSEAKRTLPYGLYSFMTQYGVEWNNLMAASIIAIIPPFLIFMFLHKYFLRGFTSGALKE